MRAAASPDRRFDPGPTQQPTHCPVLPLTRSELAVRTLHKAFELDQAAA